jgi:hypothetical protein
VWAVLLNIDGGVVGGVAVVHVAFARAEFRGSWFRGLVCGGVDDGMVNS